MPGRDLSEYLLKSEFEAFNQQLDNLTANTSQLQNKHEFLKSNSDQWFLLINGIIISCMHIIFERVIIFSNWVVLEKIS